MTQLCSAGSQERGEPLTATASRVDRWLVVEHRGAWGPQSVPTGRMARAAAQAITRQANEARARLVLVRRPHGVPDEEGRWVFAVDSRPGRERVLARHVDGDAELATVVPPFDDAAADGWAEHEGPLYLVCTHGRHDRCCALRGRPVAQALSRREPARTWECTHVGGDRFAANLVVLPEGLYLGRVEAGEVVRVVDDLQEGRLPSALVRGRSSLSLPAQAAQHFARTSSGRWGRADLQPVVQESAGDDTWRVVLSGAGGPDVEVVVLDDLGAEAGRSLLTCGATEAKPVPLFRQVTLAHA